jgi:hypothetical protein
MNLPGNQIAKIREWCQRCPQTFTEIGLDSFIKVPRAHNQMKQALLILAGCRPEESQEEVINFHCEQMGLIYWKTFDVQKGTLHHFKLKHT